MSWIKKSLFAKLLTGMLIASVIPFFLSNVIAYQTNSNSVKRQIIELNKHSMKIRMDGLKRYFVELSDLAVSFYKDEDLMKYLQSSEITPYEALYFSQQMQKIYASHLELKAVDFMSALSGQRYMINSNGQSIQSSDPKLIKAQANEWDITKEFQVSHTGKDRILSMNKLLIDYPDSRVLGLTSLYIGPKEIAGIVSGISNPEEESSEFFLIHQKPQLAFTSDSDLNQAGDDKITAMVASIRDQNGFISGEWNGAQGVFIYATDQFRKLPLTIVRFVPDSTINKAANQTLSQSLIVQSIGVVFIIVLVTLMSYYMILRIKRMIRNMAKVQTGNFKVDKKTGIADELGVLEERFQNMVRQLDILINEEYRNRLELSTARLKMLQSQINPHFLYNTLQSIGTLALSHGVREIHDKIAELGDIFRYSMDLKTEVVTLQTELRHIENYLSLQGGRFASKLSYKVSCPPQLMNIQVPKMILQPLVENSIVHGMEKGRGNGTVHICIESGAAIEIRIIDNGKGLESKMIEQLEQSYADYQFNSDTRIGLLNVLHRLQLYYGPEFHWGIRSVPYEATVVSFTIPYQTAEGRTES
jgi:two-component system sensor histidine kinase YesM